MQVGQSSHYLEELGRESPSDADMCENTFEWVWREMDLADPQWLVTKSQCTDVSLRRSTRVWNAPDKLNISFLE